MITKDIFKKKVFIPYFTFGDPSIETTVTLIKASFDSGADIVELGIPFSDPIADGPVIQASHQRALTANPNVNLIEALRVVSQVRMTHSQPIVFMSAVNLVFHYGIDRFFQDAHRHGLDGVIIPDLPIEEAYEFARAAKGNKVSLIFLVSPLCSDKRMRKIVMASTGFVYLIASTGTTGARDSVSESLVGLVKKIKAIKDIPVVVGFGISSKSHIHTVWSFADGVIVGSYLVKMIEKKEDPIQGIRELLLPS